MNDYVFDFIDLTHIEEIKEVKKFTHLYSSDFDKRTVEYYKVLRTSKLDPITNNEVDETYAFKFSYMWDPLTGERLGLDPYGSLYFDPNNLAYHFYTSRLTNLWEDAKDEKDGFFEGHYGMAVGAGENIMINSRGECPDKYLFRLPIIDCYLQKEHKFNYVTMGPKLTEKEIIEIYYLVNKMGTYKNMFDKNPPDLVKMFHLYNQALSKTPYIDSKTLENVSKDKLQEVYLKANYHAVDQLVYM
jgi:hypothetical protein